MNLTKCIRIWLASFVFSMISCRAAEARIWTDVQGRKVEATLVKLDGDDIILRTADGAFAKVPFARLSAEDQFKALTMISNDDAAPLRSDLRANASVAEAAERIDGLVLLGLQAGSAKLKEAAGKKAAVDAAAGKPPSAPFVPLTPNPRCSDDQFVRRIYLDIAGRIPTYQETVSFIRNSDTGKRAKLIDALLVSDGYVSHSFNYFADMLRVRDSFEGTQIPAHNYSAWIKEQLRKNTPWDKMVYEMIAAKGKVWNNGAAGYLLRDSGMPLDNLANTLNVFLGADLACAQCHDHPFAEWTQKQFYEMASFFGATTTRLNDRDFPDGDPAKALAAGMEEQLKKQGKDPAQFMGQVQGILNDNRIVVHDLNDNRTKLPFDYKYKDGQPDEPVAPKLITWSQDDSYNPAYIAAQTNLELGQVENHRTTFAAWMTHPQNPRFAMTIANRLWARAMGCALTSSVRNIENPDDSYNPDLLKHLAREMVRLKFDMKKFMRVIYNTKAYQREATTSAVAMGEPYYFQGPVPRRMSAEQVWDSYLTLLLGADVDKFLNNRADDYGHAIDLDVSRTTVQSLASKLTALQNLAKMQQERLGGGLANAGKAMMDEDKILVYGSMKLMRAAELEQPAPAGHFLREFGQSSRLLIDDSVRTGSTPQIMMMMNGPCQLMLTDKESLIHRTLKSIKDPSDKTEAIFLSILNRRCTFKEKDIAQKELKARGDSGYSNMIWALVNSREFFFVQ